MTTSAARKFMLIAVLTVTLVGRANGQTLYVPNGAVANSGTGSVVLYQPSSHPWGFGLQTNAGWGGWTRQYAFHSSDGTQLAALMATGNTGNGLVRISLGKGVDSAGATGPEWFTVLPSGNIGIATTTPQSPLHVMGGWSAVRVDSDVYGNHYTDVAFFKGSTRTGGIRSHNALSSQPGLLEFWSETGNVSVSGGALGIGTPDPGAKLEVLGSANGWAVTSGTSQGNASARFGNNQTNGVLDIGVNSGSGAWFQYTDRQDLSAGYPIILNPNGGNVGIGTTNPTQKLSVNGTIRAKEVIVEASPWPDDVFEKGYKLKTLNDVVAHIEEHGHLPDVPNAAAVAEEGVSVGEMQATLLRKIEELTLYVIDLGSAAESQKAELRDALARIHGLEAENAELRAMITNDAH